jgi:putative tricarboxylic transport membrane protein
VRLYRQNLPAERASNCWLLSSRRNQEDSWKQALVSNNWSSSWQTGKALREFLEVETSTAQLMTYLLKLKS